MSASSTNPGGKGGFAGPDTRAPGGGGMDYNGNPIGGGLGGQFNMGGPQLIGGGVDQPIYGGRPAPGDLYRPGFQEGGPGAGGYVPPQSAGDLFNDIIGLGTGAGREIFRQIPGLAPIGDAIGQVGQVGQVVGNAINTAVPGGGRFQPRGIIPPAGARPGFGNPRQVNPGGGSMRPGMPQPIGRIGQPGVMPGGKGGFAGPTRPTGYQTEYRDGSSRNF